MLLCERAYLMFDLNRVFLLFLEQIVAAPCKNCNQSCVFLFAMDGNASISFLV